ncbi:hypothetical protein GCM10009530_75740 [Microbispora corallina]|uniref:Serine protease n=1 Tax=Microbispora corallina TaxID=83302 RepID=A0ABQ4FZZ1_9ACTN|nr:hypothetical protein [Microbispora corallina]GIH40381.1 hypothetical protein Mco01_33810 [Microbispora corallina]
MSTRRPLMALAAAALAVAAMAGGGTTARAAATETDGTIPHRAAAVMEGGTTAPAFAAETDGATARAAGADTPGKADADRPVVVTDPVPDGFTSWEEVNRAQQQIDAVADQIEEIAATPDGAGFGSIVTEPAAGRLRLYWKGAPPASVRALLARDTGVSVVVERAAYSAAELQAEITRMTAAKPAGLEASVNQVTGVAPRPDSGGLQVFVSGDAESGRELANVRSASVPVTVRGSTVPRLASRDDDSRPYYGGARWGTTGLPSCSTGFAVSIGGQSRMLGAGHCASDGQWAYDGGGTIDDIMGKITKSSDPKLDALLIATPSAGRIFDGGPGGGEYTNPVAGRHFNHPGDYVCTSGAYSGTRCGIEIVDTNVTQTFFLGGKPVGPFNRLVLAEQVDGANAGGNGDSGGPVIEVDPVDTSKVWAKGIFTGLDAGGSPVACTGVPTSASRQCSWRIWYTSIAQILNSFGGDIVTG